MNIAWDAKGYESNFSFVPGYGAAVADLLDVTPGMTCLDLGCGNGTLTAELAARGLDVTGMDASSQMLELARSSHPELRFIEGDATSFSLDEPVDAVFSNAVLHWIDEARQSDALGCVAAALRPGGQFVFEMGGYGCAAAIHGALARAFERHGMAYELAFYFPTVGEYAPLVEAAGMRVTFATLFDRPTPLVGENGLVDWIRMFDKAPFEGVEPALADELIAEAVAELEPTQRSADGVWYADYVRLRMRAVKSA
jgi:trans-aconitate methyltransferase